MPHDHARNLCTFSTSTVPQVEEAIASALNHKSDWESMPWNERSVIFLK